MCASGMHFICAALWTWTASAADCSEPLQHFGACISALLCFRARNTECYCFMLCSLHQGLSFNRTISALPMMGACCITCADTRPEMNSLSVPVTVLFIYDATDHHLLSPRTSPRSAVEGAFESCSRAVLRSLHPRPVKAFLMHGMMRLAILFPSQEHQSMDRLLVLLAHSYR